MKTPTRPQPSLVSSRRVSAGPTLALLLLALTLLFAVACLACSTGAAPDNAAGADPNNGSTGATPGNAAGSTPANGSTDAAPDDAAAADLVPDFPIILYQGAAAVGVPAMGDSVLLMLSDLRGQPVVLNFWAGLCPPCRAEMPEFQHFADQYAGRALVVGVDLGQFFRLGSQDDAQALLNELGVTYPAGYTDDPSIVRELLITGLPATLFITADGALHRKWTGVLNESRLTEIADEMLAQ